MSFVFYEKIGVIGACTLISLSLAGCSFKPILNTSGEVASFDRETQAQLQEALNAGMLQDKVPGVIVGIWSQKGAWVHAQGYADVKDGTPLSASQSFRIASNTKMFTAHAIMMLADQGKLSLDDKLSKYIQGVKNGNNITIRQMLNMTSGVFDYTKNDAFNNQYLANPVMPFSDQDFMAVIAKGKQDFAPGKGWKYSNSNYYLLGMIIEKVTNRKAEDVIMDMVIKPSGLSNTYFPASNDLPNGYAHGYKYMDGKLTDFTTQNPRIAWTAGAMVSDIYDMKAWVKTNALGQLLSPSMQTEHLKWLDQPNQKGDLRYGLGTMYIDQFIGHTGIIFGYNTFMGYSPKDDATVIIMASTEEGQPAVNLFAQFTKILWPGDLAKSRLAK